MSKLDKQSAQKLQDITTDWNGYWNTDNATIELYDTTTGDNYEYELNTLNYCGAEPLPDELHEQLADSYDHLATALEQLPERYEIDIQDLTLSIGRE